MKNGKPAPADARALRQRAEQKLREHQALAQQPPSEIDTRALVHELQVHQIELEMQNEELRRAGARAQEALDKYADLFDFAPLGYFQLTQDGVIREANLAGAALLGLERSRVVSGRFAAWLAPVCLQTFANFRKAVLASETKQTCEIQLLCQGRGALDVQLEGLAAPEQAGLDKAWRLAVLDITERKRLEDALRFVAECGSAASGEDFFQALARYLGQSLGMDFVCIDRLEEGSLTARTVAIYFDGRFEDNVSYALKDTPCGDVVGKTVCCFPRDVRRLFPKDAVLQEMVAESYVGVTVWGTQGQPIGLIAVLGRKPLADTRLASSILQVVAVRAAAELERRQVEETLRVSEQRYRSLFEHMLHGFAYCRMLYENGLPRDFIYLEVNSAFERLTGLKNVTGKKVSEVISGVRATNPELFEIYGRVALTGQSESFETLLPSLGIWFAVSVYSPSKEHFVAVFDNITDRKRAEEALRLSEQRYRLLFDKNPDGVFVVDTTGRFVVANPACEVISGYPIAELLQKSFMDLCAPDQLVRTVEHFERGVREVKSLHLETALLRKDGRRIEVWIAGGPIAAGGKTVTVHCTARDITERKRLEEEIRRRAEELHATNAELLRFNEVMVGRELRMIELKQEINALCAQSGQPLRYPCDFQEEPSPASDSP